MNVLEQFASWISQNESLFSGLAALVALAALVPAALAPVLRKRKAAAQRAASPRSTASAPNERPRLAVFPFAASGGDDALVMAAEVVTDELTALLARSGGCEVISRRSSLAFAARGAATSEAGRELDVRYVVEGQLRSADGGQRVSASLIDSAADRVVWSDAFEVAGGDAMAISQALAERVAAHLGVEVTRAEIGRARGNVRSRAARDLMLRAQGILFDEGHSRSSYERAIALLEQAIAKESSYAEAHGLIALLVALGNIFGYYDFPDAARERAQQACSRAIEIDDRSSDVLGYVGCAYCDMRLYAQGVPLLERAIAINPSNAQAKAALGTAQIGQKQLERGAQTIEDALAITPAYKGIAPWATVLASAYLQLGRPEQATTSIEAALRCDPSFFPAHLAAAGVALLEGAPERARHHTREARRLNPALDVETLGGLIGRRTAKTLSEWLD